MLEDGAGTLVAMVRSKLCTPCKAGSAAIFPDGAQQAFDSRARTATLVVMFGRWIFAGPTLVLALVTAASAHAQSLADAAPADASPADALATKASPAPGPRLEWRAPAQCPTRDEVLAQIATLAERDRLRWDRFDVIRARIERQGAGWSLALEFVAAGGVRRRAFSSGRCADLGQAAAVAIVLAHRSGESETADGWDSSAPPEPRDGAALLAPQATSPSAAGPAAPAEDAGEHVVARSTDDAKNLTLAASAEAALDPTTLGTAAFGAVVEIELGLGPIATALYGAGFPAAATHLAAGQSIVLGLWTGGLRGCYRWGRGIDTCALMELGQVTAKGVGLVGARQSHDLWAAPGLSASFTSAPFDGFGITTRLSAFHPLERGRYRVDENDVVHRLPAVGLRATLGISIPLL